MDCIGCFKIRSLGGFGKIQVSSEPSGFIKAGNIFTNGELYFSRSLFRIGLGAVFPSSAAVSLYLNPETFFALKNVAFITQD